MTRQDKLSSNLSNLCSSCTEFLINLVSDWSKCFCPFSDTLLIVLSFKLVGQLFMAFFQPKLWSCCMEFRCLLASDWLSNFRVFVDRPLIRSSSYLISKLMMDPPYPINFCSCSTEFLPFSDSLSSCHASGDKQLTRFSPKSMGKLIMGVSWPD